MKYNFQQLVQQEKKEIIKLMVVFSLALFVFFVGWNKIVKTDTYSSFNSIYNEFAVKIVKSIGGAFGTEINYQVETKILSTETNSSKLIMPVEAYKYFLVGFISLVLLPLKLWKSSISAVLFVLLFTSFRAAVISYNLLVYKGTVHNVLLVWIDPTIFIPMLVLGLYFVKNNNVLNYIYLNIESRFSEVLTVSFSKLLFLLILVPPLPRVIFTYLHSDIMPGIVSFILHISKFFIGFAGKTALISGRFIHIENNWIDLEYPCIGLGVFTLIAVLILSIHGNLINKIIYLSGFAIVYSILNALRLSVLLLYINKTYNQIGINKLQLHDVATYFMYLVAFVGFFVYWLILNSNNNRNVCK